MISMTIASLEMSAIASFQSAKDTDMRIYFSWKKVAPRRTRACAGSQPPQKPCSEGHPRPPYEGEHGGV